MIAHHPPETGPRVLSLGALRRFAARLAAERGRWEEFARAACDGDIRSYEQIWDTESVNAWVIRWTEAADTGFHDHDESGAGIAVVAGSVREDRLALCAAPRRRRFHAGETFAVAPVAIHRVLHAGTGPAVTIHAYSPPLSRTGAYRVGPDGVLERESQPFEQPLRAVASLV